MVKGAIASAAMQSRQRAPEVAHTLRIGSERDRDCHGLDGLALVLARQGKRIEAIPMALPEA
jgi:hypothetical protein